MPINVIKDNTITNTGVPAVINNVWSNLLPSGYTQLEYIQSSGTQWINTGITGEVRIVGKGQGVSLTSTSSLIVGSNTSGTGGTFFGTVSTEAHIGFGVQASTGLSSILFLDVAEFDLNFVNNGTNTGTVNGESISRTHTIGQGAWYIFSAGNAGTYSARYKLQYLQMYQNNTLVANFIPAKNSSNVIGMYDTVTNTFFTNAGTGDFIAGPAQPSYTIKGNTVQTNNLLPVEYKAIDFIESHGTEYIDTGYAQTLTTTLNVQASFTSITNGRFGAFGRDAIQTRFYFGVMSGYWGCGINSAQYYHSMAQADTNIHTFSIGREGDTNFFKIDGVSIGTVIGGTTPTENTLYLFAEHEGAVANYFASCKLYSCKITDNGKLVRDMIPAKRLTDNVLGMYDKVEGKFYTNKGTGSFSGAEEMSENLFDITSLTTYRGYWVNSASGQFQQNDTYTHTNYIDVKPDTTYFRTSTNTSSVILYNANKEFIKSVVISNNIFTTPANAYYAVYNVPNSLDYSQGMCVEGSTAPTSYTPYGQIPADTDNTCDIPSPTHPVELHSVGDKTENLLNKNDSTLVSGYYLNANGSQGQSDTWFITPYISCEPNTVYSQYGITNKGGAPSICYYDINKNYISGTTHNGGILYPITTPANAYYFRDSFHVNDKDDMTIVKGSTAPTSYIPYGYAVPISHNRQVPAGYTQLEYLESSGGQYINTGVIPTINTGVKVKYAYPTVDSSTSAAICGIYSTDSPRKDALFISSSSGKTSSRLFGAHKGTSTSTGGVTIVANTIYTSSINFLNDGYIKLEDYSLQIGSGEILTNTIYLFARCYNGSYVNGVAKIYQAQFTEGETLIHNFIPAKRNSDNVLGMYDTVNNVFYTNNGTGTFTAGSEVGSVQTIYSANPLRKISDTYYDYIDYENQRIVRNIGVRICTGTETYNKWGSSTNKIWFDISDKQPSLDILCNCYKKSEYQIATQLQNNEIVGSSSSKSCILCDSVNAVDVTTFKAWLAEQYNNNNPVTILYPLATPTYEAITLPVLPVETQDKLNLYNVQTKLAPSEISVTYRGNLVEGHNITYNNKYYPIKYNNTDY